MDEEKVPSQWSIEEVNSLSEIMSEPELMIDFFAGIIEKQNEIIEFLGTVQFEKEEQNE